MSDTNEGQSIEHLWQPIKLMNWDEYLATQGLKRLTPQEVNDMLKCEFKAKED